MSKSDSHVHRLVELCDEVVVLILKVAFVIYVLLTCYTHICNIVGL